MLQKLFRARKLAPSPNPIPTAQQREEKSSSGALKIIHAGGRVDLYYMAVPAARIMEKYPSFMLARPEVFRRPWDAVVCPEEMLFPGQKYFVVPLGTVKKLKRRIKKPIGNGMDSGLLSNSQSSVVDSLFKEESFSRSNSSFVQNRFGILIKSKSKITARNRRVRFFGIDSKKDSVSSEKSRDEADNSDANKSQNHQLAAEKRRSVRSTVHQWQPSLTSITEDQ